MDTRRLAALIEADGADAPGPGAVGAFERRLEAMLPDDYRAFLASTPGGEFGPVVTFPLGVERDFLARVLGLGAAGACAIEDQLEADRAEGVLPHGLLRIMEGRGGDAIALVVRPDRRGEVVFVDHEVADPDEPRPTLEAAESDDWGYVLALAPSFSAFAAGLAVEPD